MPRDLSIDIDAREAISAIGRVRGALEGAGRRGANLRGARAVQNYLREYHRDYAARRGWDNPDAPTHGPGRQNTQFGRGVAEGWSATATATGAQVANSQRGMRLKLKGGVVRARSARAMTVPVDPRAHGRRAREFESFTGLDLFRPRGRDFLAVEEGDELVPIYVLRKSVKHAPWPGALPPGEEIARIYSEELVRVLDGE